MASKGLVVRLHIVGARETLAALKALPADASVELRDASRRIAQTMQGRIRSAAVAEGGQAAAVAKTVRARRDRLPVVVAGGTRRVGRHRTPAYRLLFGSEFGMNQRSGWYARPRYASSVGRQYKPHRGRASYWFFTTVDDSQAEMVTEWRRAADTVIRRFGDV